MACRLGCCARSSLSRSLSLPVSDGVACFHSDTRNYPEKLTCHLHEANLCALRGHWLTEGSCCGPTLPPAAASARHLPTAAPHGRTGGPGPAPPPGLPGTRPSAGTLPSRLLDGARGGRSSSGECPCLRAALGGLGATGPPRRLGPSGAASCVTCIRLSRLRRAAGAPGAPGFAGPPDGGGRTWAAEPLGWPGWDGADISIIYLLF